MGPTRAGTSFRSLGIRTGVVPTCEAPNGYLLRAVPQVVLHVGRDRDKRRRLSEIAVLRAGEDGRVRVATAWHVDTGFGSAAGDLRNMVRDRGVL